MIFIGFFYSVHTRQSLEACYEQKHTPTHSNTLICSLMCPLRLWTACINHNCHQLLFYYYSVYRVVLPHLVCVLQSYLFQVVSGECEGGGCYSEVTNEGKAFVILCGVRQPWLIHTEGNNCGRKPLVCVCVCVQHESSLE